MKLEVGEIIPGGYRLTERLGSLGWYISTWRARHPCGEEVVVKFYSTVVCDDYPEIHDLREKIHPLLPGLDRLVAARPTAGLAPWLSYSYDPDGHSLFLIRRYYATRLDQRFSPEGRSKGESTPSSELVAAFRQLAAALDDLCRFRGEDPAVAVHEDNLFTEGSLAMLADYGCSDLQRVVENGYGGPRPVDERQLKRAGEYFFLERTGGDAQEKAQSALAAAYFRVRSGRRVFGDSSDSGKTDVCRTIGEAIDRVLAYMSTKRLELSLLRHRGERAAVARALAIDPRERFRSCVEFADCLPS